MVYNMIYKDNNYADKKGWVVYQIGFGYLTSTLDLNVVPHIFSTKKEASEALYKGYIPFMDQKEIKDNLKAGHLKIMKYGDCDFYKAYASFIKKWEDLTKHVSQNWYKLVFNYGILATEKVDWFDQTLKEIVEGTYPS